MAKGKTTTGALPSSAGFPGSDMIFSIKMPIVKNLPLRTLDDILTSELNLPKKKKK